MALRTNAFYWKIKKTILILIEFCELHNKTSVSESLKKMKQVLHIVQICVKPKLKKFQNLQLQYLYAK